MALRRVLLGAAAVLAACDAAVAAPEERHESSRTLAIGSSGGLSGLDRYGATAGRSVEKLHEGVDRIEMSGPGVTLMEGVSLGNSAEAHAHASHEAAGRPLSLIRRHAVPSERHERPGASAPAGDTELIEQEVKTSSAKKATSKAVSWESCENGSCRCYARRRVVIRYQRERASGSFGSQVNTYTSWYYRSRQAPYVNTTAAEFSKGFTTNANNLPTCGGDAAWAKDCNVEPQACTFDAADTNPYDAKAGEYCCSGQLQYCSYKCQGNEEFKCPTLTTDINFPGGMDPAGPDVYKRCYMAQYAHGMNPESSTDADSDVDGHAD